MDRYTITILVETDEDPSALLDAVDHLFSDEDCSGNLGLGSTVRLDPAAVEQGTAVSVEEQ